jgi:hypothetical protein
LLLTVTKAGYRPPDKAREMAGQGGVINILVAKSLKQIKKE